MRLYFFLSNGGGRKAPLGGSQDGEAPEFGGLKAKCSSPGCEEAGSLDLRLQEGAAAQDILLMLLLIPLFILR